MELPLEFACIRGLEEEDALADPSGARASQESGVSIRSGRAASVDRLFVPEYDLADAGSPPSDGAGDVVREQDSGHVPLGVDDCFVHATSMAIAI